MKKIYLFLLFLAYAEFNFAQSDIFKACKLNENNIEIQLSTGKYILTPFSDKIIQTRFIPNNNTEIYHAFALEMKPQVSKIKIVDKGNVVLLKTKGINVRITKKPFQITYFHNSELLIKESGVCYFSDTLRSFNFKITQNEKLYGGGSRVLGLNRRGYKLELYNKAHYGFTTHSTLMNYSLPLVISSKKYAVLFDNPAKGFLDLDSKKNNTLTYSATGGAMAYYVVAGNHWYDLVKQYTALTGRQPLPPRWAFGNFASRFGYHSQKEVLETADKFIEEDFPLEAIILDIYWFGKEIMGTMGNLDWHRDSFPNPDEMISSLKAKNIKPILITEPFILTTSKRWDEAVENNVPAKNSVGEAYTYDFFFGNTGLIDVFDENARAWFWNIYKDLKNQGIEGTWGDLGEPEVHPADIRHKIGSGDELHNAYGHKWAEIIYEGYKKDFPNERPFILMRAGYAGSQRFGMIPWTGDVSRSWGGLVSQPEISLAMGMQGIAYMHSDLGGFAGDDPIDDELYIRWLQYGVFQPIYRPHAQEAVSPEQIFQNDSTKAHVRNAIELRYKLLPYIYNMAFENSQTGKPLMIPLFFNESDNKKLENYDKAYMWGDAFLVSPVKEAGLKEQTVYLPKGSSWFDYYTDEKYVGGQEITKKLSIENIPTFVKGGSIIPIKKGVKNTENYNLQDFEIHYYIDAKVKFSDYTLYNDDGKTANAFAEGKYELIQFRVSNKGKKIKNTIAIKNLKNVPNIKFVIHNVEKEPKSISQKNIKYEWDYNAEKSILEFTAGESSGNFVIKF